MNNSGFLKISITLVLCSVFPAGDAANILVLVPTFSPSNLIIEMPVAKAMAERSHNVTVVSTLPLKPEWLHPSMKHIHLQLGLMDINATIDATQGSVFGRFNKVVNLMNDIMHTVGKTLDDPKMQELLLNSGNKFDLILYGYLYADFYFGLAEHFDCPVALIWPNIPVAPLMKLIGNPLEMAYTPLSFLNRISSSDYNEKPGFMFRLKNLFVVGMELFAVYSRFKSENEIYR